VNIENTTNNEKRGKKKKEIVKVPVYDADGMQGSDSRADLPTPFDANEQEIQFEKIQKNPPKINIYMGNNG
jgi:hypothetical protein